MKKIGRVVMVLCAVLLIVVMTAACGGSEETKELNVEGTWKLALNEDGLTADQVTIYKNYLEGLEAQENTLVFGENGAVKINAKVGGKEVSENGSYTVADEIVTVTDPSGHATGTMGTFKLVYQNNKLIMQEQSMKYICFVKQ